MANVAGTERVMSDKINWLAEHGHIVSLVTYEQGNHPLSLSLHPNVKINDLDVRFFKLCYFSFIRKMWCLKKMKSIFKVRLQKVVDDFSPDVIIATTYSINLLKEIVYLDTTARIIMESHTACFSVSKEYDYYSNYIMRFVGRLYDAYNYRSLRALSLLIVLTDGDKRDWSRYTNKLKVLPNPLTYYPKQIEEKKLPNRIICVGRLNVQKGFDLLIDAFAMIASQCAQWHIDIYGHGEDENKLHNQIRKHSLDTRVRIHKPIANIYKEYMQSDFLVLSSRYEGFGLVLVEAMSCGIPCVAFKCKYGPDEIIKDGIDGLLVENGAVSDLANKMLWMIKHDSERMEMGKMARNSALRYKKERVMLEWEYAYLEE